MVIKINQQKIPHFIITRLFDEFRKTYIIKDYSSIAEFLELNYNIVLSSNMSETYWIFPSEEDYFLFLLK